MPACLVQHMRGQLGGFAETHGHDTRQSRTWREERAYLALAALESGHGEGPRDSAPRRFIRLLPDAKWHLPLANQKHERT